jgi:hypothetical protein
VVADTHIKFEVDRREVIIVGGRNDKGGARGKEGQVKAVQVFERRSNIEEKVSADEGGVGEAAPIKGGDRLTNKLFDGSV